MAQDIMPDSLKNFNNDGYQIELVDETVTNNLTQEARNLISERLCSLGYCQPDSINRQEEDIELSRSQRQFSPQISQDYSNFDYQQFIGEDGIPPNIPLNPSDGQVSGSPPSTHIHHHYHHGAQDNSNHRAVPSISAEAIRNAKNYLYEQQRPSGIKRVIPSNNYFGKPQTDNLLYSNPNQINTGSFNTQNKRRPQYAPNINVQNQLNDCSCVAYQYCASDDVVGRRDDNILPLDPRHVDKNIDAISSNLTDEILMSDFNKNISKRDVSEQLSKDIEPVSIIF